MGGGGSNSAQQQADANERERQAQIAATSSQINALFNDPKRTAQYDQLAKDTTQYYTDDLNRQNAIAARKMKFALANSGLLGSSQQAAEGAQLGDDYQKGLLTAQRRGNQAASDLRSADESSRMQLLGMAESGADMSTLSSNATSSLLGNLQSGQSQATANDLGNLFGNLSDVYANSQDAEQKRRGMLYGYNQLYSPMYGAGGNGYNPSGGY